MATDDANNNRQSGAAEPLDRVLSLVDDSGKELFEIEELRGSEAISRPFEFALSMRRLESAGKPPAGLLGTPLAIRWQIGAKLVRTVHGMFRRFVRTSQRGRYRRYSAIFVPPVWPLTQNRNCRIFQDKTVREILEELLRTHFAEFRIQTSDYDRRSQAVQYLESDFDFAQRLMEEAGIHYYFDPTRQNKLVIADASRSNPPIAEPAQVRVRDASGQTPENGGIFQLDVAENVVFPKVGCIDHCFQKKGPRLEAMASCGPSTSASAVERQHGQSPEPAPVYSLESFGATAGHFNEVGPESKDGIVGEATVKNAVVRKAELLGQLFASDRKRLTATSDDWRLVPGFQFDLVNASGHDDGKYLIVSIEHSYRRNESQRWSFSNSFECLAIDVPFRPALTTPKPTMGGLHAAIVVGPPKTPTWTDRYGRVQVRFFWQSEKRSEERTCWVRLAQTWAGKNYGAVQTPRVGDEVLVEFLNDDPDQPVVVGSLHSERNPAPCTLPAEAAVSGIRSRTNADGAKASQSSHLYFVDEPGKEQLHLHAERHAHLSAEKSMTHLVGWGATSGEKNYLSSASQEGTSEFDKYFFNLVDAGHVQKVKGVQRHSVWGHEIDVTLGTSSNFVIGGWSQAHVGLGAALDVGLRTDLVVGLHVEVNIAPHFVFSVGAIYDAGTGSRFVKTAKSMTQVVSGDYIEKISGSHIVRMGGYMPMRTMKESSGNFQFFDVATFRLHVNGPEALSPDALKVEDLIERQMDLLASKTADQMNKLHPNNPPEFVEFPDFDEHLPKVEKQLASMYAKYATTFTARVGDIKIGSARSQGKLLIAGDEINLVAKEVNYYCEENSLIEHDVEKTRYNEMFHPGGVFLSMKEAIRKVEGPALTAAAQAQIAATQAKGLASAAAAIPGVVVAGAALAGGIIAAADKDPAEWGL